MVSSEVTCQHHNLNFVRSSIAKTDHHLVSGTIQNIPGEVFYMKILGVKVVFQRGLKSAKTTFSQNYCYVPIPPFNVQHVADRDEEREWRRAYCNKTVLARAIRLETEREELGESRIIAFPSFSG